MPGNKVYWQGGSYVCLKPCTGVTPVDGEYWQLVVRSGFAEPGTFGFDVVDGRLICYYQGEEPPPFRLGEDGHLYADLEKTVDLGAVKGSKGDAGVGIQSVEQTTSSTENGGINVVTVTKTDGTSSTFQVRNGSQGGKGETGLGVPAATAEDAGKVPVVQEDGSYGLIKPEDKPIYLGTVPVSADTALYCVVPVKDYKKVVFIKERPVYGSALKTNLWFGLYPNSYTFGLSVALANTPGYTFITAEIECFEDFAAGWSVQNNNIGSSNSVYGLFQHSSEISRTELSKNMPVNMDTYYYGFYAVDPALAFDGNETVHVWGWKR